MTSTSKAFTLDVNDATKLGKGALIAAAGAVITYLAEWIAGTDFGDATPVVVAVAGILVNASRKWLMDYSNNRTH